MEGGEPEESMTESFRLWMWKRSLPNFGQRVAALSTDDFRITEGCYKAFFVDVLAVEP